MTARPDLQAMGQRWLDAYVHAWKTGAHDAVSALFTPDVRYTPDPFSEPIVGREAVVAWWLEDPDEPDTFDARYTVTAVDGETGLVVAEGFSEYFSDARRDILIARFANVFFLRFDADGRVREYREVYALDGRDSDDEDAG
jgi:limonene-1,2-epoxide hydrolase